MKRSRRRTKPASDLGVAADVATDDTSNVGRPRRGNRYQKMKLPHERDESAHPPGEPDPVTAQAARDVEQGKVDTDCYDAAGRRFDRKEQP
jgi:hypothetical protein